MADTDTAGPPLPVRLHLGAHAPTAGLDLSGVAVVGDTMFLAPDEGSSLLRLRRVPRGLARLGGPAGGPRRTPGGPNLFPGPHTPGDEPMTATGTQDRPLSIPVAGQLAVVNNMVLPLLKRTGIEVQVHTTQQGMTLALTFKEPEADLERLGTDTPDNAAMLWALRDRIEQERAKRAADPL